MNELTIAVGAIVVIAVLASTYFAMSRKKKVDPIVKAQIAKARLARKNWRKAVKSNSKQSKALAAQLENLTSQTGALVASFGGVTLYERWIQTPQGSGSLIGVTAQAADESTIDRRITATRLVTLGLFALAARKKSGGGNVYVVIDGPSVSGVATLQGDKDANNGPKAYDFAAKVNNAARAAEAFESRRPHVIQETRESLLRLREAQEVTIAAQEYATMVADLPPEFRGRFSDANTISNSPK
jgi:hypothetical protein